MASWIGLDQTSRVEKDLGGDSSKVIDKERTIDVAWKYSQVVID